VVNPYWNVPESIAQEELWPIAARDPGYLARNNYEVYSQGGERAIRQRPGPGNALGEVKFLFPNRHNVYLHDTPADHLFSQSQRAFSHGCVRVEKPRELARLLFRMAADRDPGDFDRLAAEDTEKWVNVEHEMPVYILYFTAWARPDGVVNFYSDVYRRDRNLREQVDERLITGAERRLRSWMQAAERNREGS
jgi:murein L,D-transpeptidase YcbB/YkuD